MIFFIILFLIIIGISVYLAYSSMKDVFEFPENTSSLFLIRNPGVFSGETLRDLRQKMQSGQIISLERLFKGSKSALVIYGSGRLLQEFHNLDLLELLDYSQVKKAHSLAWEIKKPISPANFKLAPDEELWLQYVCQTHSSDFSVHLRAVLISSDSKKKDHKSSTEILRDYRKRSIAPMGKGSLKISPENLFDIILPQNAILPQPLL